MSLGNYCRDYRVSSQATLSDICRDCKEPEKLIKSLSAFEHGRSTNFNHISHYVHLSYERGEHDQFAKGLIEVLNYGY